MTATNSERSFNEALARVLWTKHPAWRERVTAEQHRAVKGGGQPDLIVRNPLGAPVVVETEYLPARTVEQNAIARLGRELADSGYAVEQCIAVRAPSALQETPQPHLDAAAAKAEYEYCLFTRTDLIGHVRWPRHGWLTGGVDDLASLIENASISERVVARSLDILEAGIHEAAVRLRGATVDRPDVNASVAEGAAPRGRRADFTDGDGDHCQRAHLPHDAGGRPRRADVGCPAAARRAAKGTGSSRVGAHPRSQLLADQERGRALPT